jgi:hypothetical protein
MLKRIRAALGRVWRPGHRTAEHRPHDQRASRSYRDRRDVDAAKGESYGWPPS